MVCKNADCVYNTFADGNGRYKEELSYKFSKEDEAAIDALFGALYEAAASAPKYDSTLHAYAEEGELYESFKLIEEKRKELAEMDVYVFTQLKVAEALYYGDITNPALQQAYSYMTEYDKTFTARTYSLSQVYYDSCYRNFYFRGMTEAEMADALLEANALSNEEYVALTIRNAEIQLAYHAISDLDASPEIPILYEEFVENNKRIAEIFGYDNYLDYIYEREYSRDYTYRDVATVHEYVKEYVAELGAIVLDKMINDDSMLTDLDAYEYVCQISESFFTNQRSNETVNDYIDLMAFTTNPDKSISFSDALNGLMSDGNLFRGSYRTAYVSDPKDSVIHIVYIGSEYEAPFYIIHEFGHYINSVYNEPYHTKLSQSYDLLEIHSQGNEMLYLAYLKDNLSEKSFSWVSLGKIYSMFNVMIASFAIDTFEQAVYLGSYDGTNADVIMEDGRITADEYDLLYYSILVDFGVQDIQSDSNWRYGVVANPGYYISYGMSALSALQLYAMANTEGFDVARDTYLKFFTYADAEGGHEMTTEEIIEYAGMPSVYDEEFYIYFSTYFKSI
jgi:hypothetical protein